MWVSQKKLVRMRFEPMSLEWSNVKFTLKAPDGKYWNQCYSNTPTWRNSSGRYFPVMTTFARPHVALFNLISVRKTTMGYFEMNWKTEKVLSISSRCLQLHCKARHQFVTLIDHSDLSSIILPFSIMNQVGYSNRFF